ncbi:MAG: GYF domain-containing protein [Polyangiaceae bacterium]
MASARLARKEGRVSNRRSLTSTLPADSAPPSRLWLSDRPGWCVDLGETLVAMRTADLWLALAKDEIGAQTKVWREGMPYWTEIENVPEFALAMPDATVWAPGDGPRRMDASNRKTDTAAPASAVRAVRSEVEATDVGSEASLPAPPSVADVMSLAPPSDFVTPAPVVVEPRASEHVASGPRRVFPRVDRRNAMSVAFGAVVAIGALLFATTGPAPGRASDEPVRPMSMHAAARPAAITYDAPKDLWGPEPAMNVEAATVQASEKAPVLAGATPAIDETPTAPERRTRSSRGPHATDRGQRRAR